ncbi:hypothetical protein [Nocardioides sp. B-3]|uniref:hypothetical protein n=1 Tax=Nocardioides sp. B-3 TaxID=2895565 RepID=UPI002152A475|nr:hypothetical protein [Nocardioides sp. B-3]UUZ61955.1 hypothetical protein LP418_13340 [Nocardioides sp. B-3]
MAAYTVGIPETTKEAGCFSEAIRASVVWILAQARANEMVQRTLRDARTGNAGTGDAPAAADGQRPPHPAAGARRAQRLLRVAVALW